MSSHNENSFHKQLFAKQKTNHTMVIQHSHCLHCLVAVWFLGLSSWGQMLWIGRSYSPARSYEYVRHMILRLPLFCWLGETSFWHLQDPVHSLRLPLQIRWWGMSPKISARPGVWLKPPLPLPFALHSTLPFPGLLLELGFPGGSVSKEYTCSAGDLGLILGQEDPLEKGMATHSSILAWEIHGQRNLVGYSPWVHNDSNMTWWLDHHHHVLGSQVHVCQFSLASRYSVGLVLTVTDWSTCSPQALSILSLLTADPVHD